MDGRPENTEKRAKAAARQKFRKAREAALRLGRQASQFENAAEAAKTERLRAMRLAREQADEA